MRTLIILCSLSFLFNSTFAHHAEKPNSGNGLTYQADGHYWTVYLVATLLKIPNAKELAFYAEKPDLIFDEEGNTVRATNTWFWLHRQGKVHALTGKDPEKERERSRRMILEAKDMKRKGWGLHRLGDSYAHAKPDEKKMYPMGIGHAFAPEGGQEPDLIRNYPEKYLRYVRDLSQVLGGPDARIDMTAFDYIARMKLTSEDNMEILKSEIMLQTKQARYKIQEAQTERVTEYLNFRMTDFAFTYSITPLPQEKSGKRKPNRSEVILRFE
jgi:hypothetical protein